MLLDGGQQELVQQKREWRKHVKKTGKRQSSRERERDSEREREHDGRDKLYSGLSSSPGPRAVTSRATTPKLWVPAILSRRSVPTVVIQWLIKLPSGFYLAPVPGKGAVGDG